MSNYPELPEPVWFGTTPSKACTIAFSEQQMRAYVDADRAMRGGWQSLTDEDRARAFNSMPDMLDGFLKTWGWLHFAKAIEKECRAKNSANQPKD